MPGHRDAKGNSAFSEQNGQCLISLSSLFTAEAMKQITVFQSVVFVCFLVSNVECTCEDRNYYSEDLSGCVGCPQAKCDDQYPADVQRCKNACETKIEEKSQVTTEASKPTPAQPTKTSVNSTSESITPPSNTTDAPKRPGDHEQPEKTDTTGNLGLSFIVGVLAAGVVVVGIVVFLVYKSCWSGHSSNAASRVNSDEKEKIEICVEPSTSSQEPSPVTKRSQSAQVKLEKEINIIQPPWQETETQNLIQSPTAGETYPGSCLHLQENEC